MLVKGANGIEDRSEGVEIDVGSTPEKSRRRCWRSDRGVCFPSLLDFATVSLSGLNFAQFSETVPRPFQPREAIPEKSRVSDKSRPEPCRTGTARAAHLACFWLLPFWQVAIAVPVSARVSARAIRAALSGTAGAIARIVPESGAFLAWRRLPAGVARETRIVPVSRLFLAWRRGSGVAPAGLAGGKVGGKRVEKPWTTFIPVFIPALMPKVFTGFPQVFHRFSTGSFRGVRPRLSVYGPGSYVVSVLSLFARSWTFCPKPTTTNLQEI